MPFYITASPASPPLAEVYQWWTLAALQGHPSAQQNLEIVARQLGREQLAAAQAAVADALRRQETVTPSHRNPLQISGVRRRRAGGQVAVFPALARELQYYW